MRKAWVVWLSLAFGGCASNALPSSNSVQTRYDSRGGVVQVMISDVQPAATAELIGADGTRYPASAVTLVSGPHVDYKPPPSVGLSIGGFGFSGCCSGFGSGVGVGVPLGGPTPSHVSDQYVASAVIPAPADYAQTWQTYHVEVHVGNRPLVFAAPAPS